MRLYGAIRPPLSLINQVAQVDQSTPERLQHLSNLIGQNFPSDKPLSVLEIGSWFGLGSSTLLSRILPSESQLVLLDTWKPYILKSDKSHKLYGYAHMDKLHEYALLSTSALADNVDNIEISVFKSNSSSSLKLIAKDSFDLIYIDGSHYYNDVLNDLRLAQAIVKHDFAIICGDDLEVPIQSHEHLNICRQMSHKDYVSDQYGRYHPGVSSAVYDFFGNVNTSNGFWYIYIVNGKPAICHPSEKCYTS